jgi:hypothetical protein
MSQLRKLLIAFAQVARFARNKGLPRFIRQVSSDNKNIGKKPDRLHADRPDQKNIEIHEIDE